MIFFPLFFHVFSTFVFALLSLHTRFPAHATLPILPTSDPLFLRSLCTEPPAEPAPPAPQPLPLTKRERKKLRTQRRLAAEKEKQDQIRCGLMPPPPPKVKISNLMQAMKDDAVADPSAMEAKVRRCARPRPVASCPLLVVSLCLFLLTFLCLFLLHL